MWQEVDEWKQLGQLQSVSIAMATKSFVADLVQLILITIKYH